MAFSSTRIPNLIFLLGSILFVDYKQSFLYCVINFYKINDAKKLKLVVDTSSLIRVLAS